MRAKTGQLPRPTRALLFILIGGPLSICSFILLMNAIHFTANELADETYRFALWNHSCTLVRSAWISLFAVGLCCGVSLYAYRLSKTTQRGSGQITLFAASLLPAWWLPQIIGYLAYAFFDANLRFFTPSISIDAVDASFYTIGLYWPGPILAGGFGLIMAFLVIRELSAQNNTLLIWRRDLSSALVAFSTLCFGYVWWWATVAVVLHYVMALIR